MVRYTSLDRRSWDSGGTSPFPIEIERQSERNESYTHQRFPRRLQQRGNDQASDSQHENHWYEWVPESSIWSWHIRPFEPQYDDGGRSHPIKDNAGEYNVCI